MAHGLCIQNGEASMMYVGEVPWHGLGTLLARPATAEEAIRAAKLDWEVSLKQLVAVDDDRYVEVPDRYVVVRRDLWGRKDDAVLGIVGGEYRPLQNREAFDFFDPLVGMDAAIYHTAGALGKGERIWILAKLPDDIRVIGDDIAEKYLLLSNSHDGSSGVQIKFTPIRVDCQNTLTLALSHGPTLSIAHRRDMHYRLHQAERALGIIHRRFDQIEEVFRKMACVRMDSRRLDAYVKLVFPDPRNPKNVDAREWAESQRRWAQHFFEEGKGNREKGVAGTLWAAYNGVAELIDHRQTRQEPDRRLRAVWFGNGYHAKARAYTIAEEKVRSWSS